MASSFISGRVLLAGDAAHVDNPLGGMGMSGGIHDAINLAECPSKIASGCAGRRDGQGKTTSIDDVAVHD